MPLLSKLTSSFKGTDADITQLTEDSRKAAPGTLFAAFKGTKTDGYDYIPAAVKQGVSAILTDRDVPKEVLGNAALIVSQNPRQTFGEIAAKFCAPLPATIAAVTGTNGKTSTAHFVRQFWHLAGKKSASIGTVGVCANEEMITGESMTTPDTVTLYKTLSDLKKRGVDHVVMEASSHGLHQARLAGVNVKAAGFTNLSRDHLDYHPTMEEYFAAKAILFKDIATETAVLNADIPEYAALKSIAEKRNLKIIDYGKGARSLQVKSIRATGSGLAISLNIAELSLPLIGLFQAENLLCAFGLAMATGMTQEEVLKLAPKLTPVPGRMEKVGEKNGAPVIVDYAHTPDALEKLLQAARPHAEKNIILVFGCGGNRDQGKRPLMGAVAAKRAQKIIVTDDNPRKEEPAEIRKAILTACPGATEIGDRKEAIRTAIGMAKAGDIVVIAGKGHETYQIIGETKHHFSDQETAREAL